MIIFSFQTHLKIQITLIIEACQFVSIDLENAYITRFRSFEPNLIKKTRKHAKSTKMSQISMFHQYFGTFLRLAVFRQIPRMLFWWKQPKSIILGPFCWFSDPFCGPSSTKPKALSNLQLSTIHELESFCILPTGQSVRSALSIFENHPSINCLKSHTLLTN